MKIKNRLITALAILSPLTVSANSYVSDVDILNAGVSAMDTSCLANAPYGAPLQTHSGEFLNFRRCLESNNYTNFRKLIPLKVKENGKVLYLGELSSLTVPDHTLIPKPKSAIKQLYVPPLFFVGDKDSEGVRTVEIRTARNYLSEQRSLLIEIGERQTAFAQANPNTNRPIQTLTVLGYKDGKENGEAQLIYMVFADDESIMIKKINADEVVEINEDRFIEETGLLVNPLFSR